jgi:release factor glutamine methyltransferase
VEAVTIREAIAEASTQIVRRDAETLLLHRLRRDRAWIFAHDDTPVSDDTVAEFRAEVARRSAGEPLQYITGEQEFYGLAIKVTPDTLIPRPETELLVEAVEIWSTKSCDDGVLRIVDVGTGSGAIAIALATRLAAVDVMAIDLSPAALRVAEENAVRHGCAERITFVENDLLNEMDLRQPFDAIVSNPPYVPSGDAATMQREVVGHEPHSALFAGEDGLAIYRRLIPQAHGHLLCGGLLAMEFGFGQRDSLAAMLQDWKHVEFRDDLQGIPRVVLATK